MHFKLEVESKIVKEIEKQLSIDNNVIRYLTVKYDKLDLTNEYFSSRKEILGEEIKRKKKVERNLAIKIG